ncbi:hypothetical protein [Staphylococcus pasteuri]|uniref:hypothetical protein n=1 Tax=Staphylococcus pasteuri TaxID=45972 RepID=UPI00207C48A4|nr:hypothetical protein [Staphylococcus pasteuri]MCO0860976.1 hypothetical protein [Staphylococcus pasteuri]
MKFNNWNIIINGLNSRHEIISNNETFLILERNQHAELVLKLDSDIIKVKSIGYSNELSIDTNTKEIIVNMTDLLDDDEE